MGPQEERVLVCPDLVPVAGMRDREQLGEAKVSLTYTISQSTFEGSPGRNPEAGTQSGDRGGCCLPAGFDIHVHLLFLYLQDHLPKHGTSHGELGPSTTIIHQDNALQLAYRPI